MHHKVFGKKLSRNTNERKNLLRNLMRSLIIHGKIKTTKAKAQASRSEVERLITKAKKGTEFMRRQVLSALGDRIIVDQLMEMAKTQFSGRNSGYTRIVKLGMRSGDASEMVLLSFVDEKVEAEVIAPAKKTAEPVKAAVAKKEVKESVSAKVTDDKEEVKEIKKPRKTTKK